MLVLCPSPHSRSKAALVELGAPSVDLRWTTAASLLMLAMSFNVSLAARASRDTHMFLCEVFLDNPDLVERCGGVRVPTDCQIV